MSFTIRAMTVEDLLAVESIQAEAYAGYFLESTEVIAQRFHSSPATAWVAEHKGRVHAYLVGYWSRVGKINPLNAPFSQSEEVDCLYLHDLALLKSAQGKGVAKQLIGAAAELALVNAAQAIALLSVQDSKYFWRSFGFSEFKDLDLKQRNNLETYLDNETDVAFYMVKTL